MNKKVSLLIISIFLTIIVFAISTHMQKKLVNYTPTMKCMIVTKDVEAYEKVTEDVIQYVEMPISIITQTRIVQDISELSNLYLKDKIYKGQMILMNQFDTKENLMIYNAENGKEKIAIKIKNSENGVSYTIRENSLINVYATIRSDYMINSQLSGDKVYIGSEEDGYCNIKLLDNVKVLGVFNENGEVLEKSFERLIDTVLIAVTPEEAQSINLIRDIASFNITEI